MESQLENIQKWNEKLMMDDAVQLKESLKKIASLEEGALLAENERSEERKKQEETRNSEVEKVKKKGQKSIDKLEGEVYEQNKKIENLGVEK